MNGTDKQRATDYWDKFYNTGTFRELTPSPFAEYVVRTETSVSKFARPRTLLDLGAGNCRDSIYFSSKGFIVSAVDKSLPKIVSHPGLTFKREDLLKTPLTGYDIIYLRFVVHAISEYDLDKLITKLAKLSKETRIYIETRSITGVLEGEKAETFLKLSVGDAHFRMLYSQPYLERKFEKLFTLHSSEHATGFAPYQNEDPFIIRLNLSPI